MAIEKCESCGKPFKIIEFKLEMPGTKEKENINCPYCNYTVQRTSNGYFITNELTEEQQKVYLKDN